MTTVRDVQPGIVSPPWSVLIKRTHGDYALLGALQPIWLLCAHACDIHSSACCIFTVDHQLGSCHETRRLAREEHDLLTIIHN